MSQRTVQSSNGTTDYRTLPRMSNPTKSNDDAHFDQGTWLSLLGLLDFFEIFVTVDQTTLWQRHIAWANKGKDIREYNTKRFATNMVFLSLLLGSTMAILVNSANFSTAMRASLTHGEYGTSKYWMGIALIVGAIVTLMGLVATYTAWGLLSAISDNNSHALLRSSIGQYVTSLPSRFVVGSLYLYLIALTLFAVEIVSGPGRFVLVALVAILFFQVVTSLSGFGRLIIHTGAMGEKRVLDPALERQLLPSGLHASLLIKAMERRRQQTAVTAQYRSRKSAAFEAQQQHQPRPSGDGHDDSRGIAAASPLKESLVSESSSSGSFESSKHSAPPGNGRRNNYRTNMEPAADIPGKRSHRRINTDENESILRTARSLSGEVSPVRGSPRSNNRDAGGSGGDSGQKLSRDAVHDNMDDDDDDDEIDFPRASILNRAGSNAKELEYIMQTASKKGSPPPPPPGEVEYWSQEDDGERSTDPPAAAALHPIVSDDDDKGNNNNNRKQQQSLEELAKRRSVAAYRRGSFSRASKRQILREWRTEEGVRDMYGYEPPVDFLDEIQDDNDKYEYGGETPPRTRRTPRSSVLDRLRFGASGRHFDDGHDEEKYDDESNQLLGPIPEGQDDFVSSSSIRNPEGKV